MLTRVNHPRKHCAHQDSFSADGIWQSAMQVHGTFLQIATGQGLIFWAGIDWQRLWWISVDLYWPKAWRSWKEALNLNQILYCTIFIQGILFLKGKCVSVRMYLQARRGARSHSLSFASGIKVLAQSFPVVLRNESEQAGSVLPPRWEAAVGAVEEVHWLHPSMQLHWHQRQGVTALAG